MSWLQPEPHRAARDGRGGGRAFPPRAGRPVILRCRSRVARTSCGPSFVFVVNTLARSTGEWVPLVRTGRRLASGLVRGGAVVCWQLVFGLPLTSLAPAGEGEDREPDEHDHAEGRKMYGGPGVRSDEFGCDLAAHHVCFRPVSSAHGSARAGPSVVSSGPLMRRLGGGSPATRRRRPLRRRTGGRVRPERV